MLPTTAVRCLGLATVAAIAVFFVFSYHLYGYPCLECTFLPKIAGPGAGVTLRLIPIGDSITKGWLSPDENGYRLDLRNMLIKAGYHIDFIGNQTLGENNPDNHHEGWGGYRISEIQQAMANDSILSQHPNIALIHAGTNDVFLPKEPIETAPDRLGLLIDAVLASDPEAVVLVAKIMQIGGMAERVAAFNDRVPNIVADRVSKGYKVIVVDQSAIGGEQDTVEGIHPNGNGCRKLATNWFNAIANVPKELFIPPQDPT